jgi:MoaA/NifB/PqqE/SkfB family radical SAM enzyme
MNISLLSRYAKIVVSYAIGHPLYPPDSVSMIVTNKCNLRCAMCDFWKDSAELANGITLKESAKLFEDLHSFGVRMIQLTGGEPFLRGDLMDILRAAKGKGLSIAIVTNGTLITEENVLEFARNIDVVYISLDAPDLKQHEEIRGVEGVFERITKSIRLLVSAVKENSLKVKINLSATITAGSLHEPEEMVKLAKNLGVGGIIYNPASAVYYGNTTLRSSIPEHDISSLGGYCRMIDRIIALMKAPGNIIRSNPFYLMASKEFLNRKERFYKFSCFGGGYNGPLIGFDGTVFPCCAWNVPLGNIREKSFSAIWRSLRAKEIRKKIKKGQCPVCYHHTRTFDFLWQAPFLFRSPRALLEGYKIMGGP